jgi:hypothetical protein
VTIGDRRGTDDGRRETGYHTLGVRALRSSLADFAKLIEQFEAHAVSFVSVTQSFNTTSSNGAADAEHPVVLARHGRPFSINTPDKIVLVQTLHDDDDGGLASARALREHRLDTPVRPDCMAGHIGFEL